MKKMYKALCALGLLVTTYLIFFTFFSDNNNDLFVHNNYNYNPQERSNLTKSGNKMSGNELKELAAQYITLRGLHSHFTGGDWNEEVDSSNSRKFMVMDKLKEQLGKAGTALSELIETMGEPDEVTRDIENPYQSPGFMPGPVMPDGSVGTSDESDEMYFCYYWRGRHDFLWFKVSDSKQQVLKSDWHNDLE